MPKIIKNLFKVFPSTVLLVALVFFTSPQPTYAALNGAVCTGSVTPSTNGSVLVKGDSSSGPQQRKVLIRNGQFDINLQEFFPPSFSGSATTIQSVEFFTDTNATPANPDDDTATGVAVSFSYSDELASGKEANTYVCDLLQGIALPSVTAAPQQFGCFFKEGWETGQVFPIQAGNDPKDPYAVYPTEEAARADCGTYIQLSMGNGKYACSPRNSMSDPDVQDKISQGLPVFHTLNTTGKHKSCESCLGNLDQPVCNETKDTTTTTKYSVINGQCAEDVNGSYTKEACDAATTGPATPSPIPTPPLPPCFNRAILSSPNPDESDKLTECTSVFTGLGIALSTDPKGFVKSLFTLLLSISGGILLLLIIWSGYQMMTSQGDQEKIKAARERITSAIIGFLFLVFSLVLLEIIGVNILRIPGFCGEFDPNCQKANLPLSPTPFPASPPSPTPDLIEQTPRRGS